MRIEDALAIVKAMPPKKRPEKAKRKPSTKRQTSDDESKSVQPKAHEQQPSRPRDFEQPVQPVPARQPDLWEREPPPTKAPRRSKPQSRAERNIAWCEEYLSIPEGQYVGAPLKMADFHKDDFHAIYDNPHAETRQAIISRPRKNGKTIQCAFILLLHLCGPEAKRNSQLFSCAQSRDQAAVLFSLAAKMVRMSPQLRSFVGVRDTAKELYCAELGTHFKALSADATTAFGLSPVLTVFDELGQCKGPRSALFEAMLTATAAQARPLTLIISTQAPTDGDLLSMLIDDAATNSDPSIVLRLDAAPLDVDPFSEEAIRIANPAFDVFQNRREVLAMAADAKRLPARESQFKNLVLNQRVEANSPFISQERWQACSGQAMDLTGREVFCGLDLSMTQDLTALVLVGADIVSGTWHVNCTFWLPSEGLHEKAKQDRIPYDLWAREGFLSTTPGSAISYEYVANHLRSVFDRYKVQKVSFDRWGLNHLKPWLTKAGFSEQMIADKFVPFGQGFASMSPALRDLEAIILERKLRHGGNPVLTMCAHNSVIVSDDAGNRKLSKKRSSGRIDGMVALTMAMGVAPLKAATFDVSALIG